MQFTRQHSIQKTPKNPDMREGSKYTYTNVKEMSVYLPEIIVAPFLF